MTWFYVDDNFSTHPKCIGISMEAVGVWTMAGTWCARHLTDGYIPADALPMVCGRKVNRAAQELVNRTLWTPTGDGWQFVDWLQWQKPRAEIEAKRADARKRQEAWRQRQREAAANALETRY